MKDYEYGCNCRICTEARNYNAVLQLAGQIKT